MMVTFNLPVLLVWSTMGKCPFFPSGSVLISLLPQPHFWAPFECLISVYLEQQLGKAILGALCFYTMLTLIHTLK